MIVLSNILKPLCVNASTEKSSRYSQEGVELNSAYRAVKKSTGKRLWAPPPCQNYQVAQSFASTQTTGSELQPLAGKSRVRELEGVHLFQIL